MDRFMRLGMVCAVVLGAASCQSWQTSAPGKRESLLRPIGLGSESMQLEVFFVRVPLGDQELNGSMWDEVDEQQLPPNVRHELADNGIRVGLIAGQPPAALSRLLSTAQRPANPLEAAASLEQAPTVRRQMLQLHSGWRGEIFTSGIWPSIPLLERDQGRVCGRTYSGAQGVLNTRTWSQADRLVKLQVTPELEYGETRQQWISEDGMLRPEPAKPKRVFDRLTFEATLAPGQMLLLTSLKDRSGTLGHYFFSEPQGDKLQQRLVVVRLAQSRFSDLFSMASASDAPAADKPTLVK